MAVLRKAHKSNFTVIDNQVFKSNLSLKARGLLSTMLSLPDNWNFSTTGLTSILPSDGRASSAPPSRNWRQMAISRESAYVMTRAKSSIGFGLSRITHRMETHMWKINMWKINMWVNHNWIAHMWETNHN